MNFFFIIIISMTDNNDIASITTVFTNITINNIELNILQCPTCKKIYKRPMPFKNHLLNKHNFNENHAQLLIENFITYTKNIDLKKFKCNIDNCAKEFNFQFDIDRHQRGVHKFNPENIYFPCEVDGCTLDKTIFSEKCSLLSHMATVHGINAKAHQYICYVDDCKSTFAKLSGLNRHLEGPHDINPTYYTCKKENCVSKYKEPSGLKDHMCRIHAENIIWYECGIDNCTRKCFTNSEIKNHRSNKHNINVTYINCDVVNCSKTFKRNCDMIFHKKSIHDINATYFYCDIDDCNEKYIRLADLKAHHKGIIHNIGTESFYCDIDNCTHVARKKIDLNSHKSYVHNINSKKYICTYELCTLVCKSMGDLNHHKKGVHDIGKNKCDLCQENKYTSINYLDTNNNNLQICRVCLKITTGKESRDEIKMSEFLDNITELQGFLSGTDVSLATLGGCSRKRPDKIYMSHELVLWIECDENAHKWYNYTSECEESRIMEVYDEFIGKKLVVIRWNPDKYVPLIGLQLSFENRLNKLKELILDIIYNPELLNQNAIQYIYYMFYDTDSDLYPSIIPYELLQ